MRRVGIWIILVGALLLSGAVWAQSPDEGVEEEEQGQAYQAPGVQVWMGRLPSREELQNALSQAQSFRPSESDEPDFQNEHVRVWIGRLPPLESMRNILRSGEEGR